MLNKLISSTLLCLEKAGRMKQKISVHFDERMWRLLFHESQAMSLLTGNDSSVFFHHLVALTDKQHSNVLRGATPR
jgi:hypothetical protein